MMADPKDLNNKLLENDLARKNTFAEIPRRTSFARAFTFDGAALQQTVQGPYEGLKRTITEVGNKIDPDAKFTKAVLSDYQRVDQEGNEGDIPLPKGFASTYKFWKIIFWGGLVSAFMGIAAAAFMNFADEVKTLFSSNGPPFSRFLQIPKQWNSCDYSNDPDCGEWYNGETYWIFLVGCAGFTVGLIRWTFDYPDNLPGIFKEIQTYHVEPKWVPITYIVSAISLGGGATLGPEQALVSRRVSNFLLKFLSLIVLSLLRRVTWVVVLLTSLLSMSISSKKITATSWSCVACLVLSALYFLRRC